MTREEYWKAYVDSYEIPVPQERVEEEIHMIRMDLMHRMRYETLSGGAIHPFPQLELEEQKEEIYAAALFEVKSTLVMNKLIAELDITVTREELEAEAAAMAQRQGTTVAAIKEFFGEDLAMLELDVKKRKATDTVCCSA